MNCIKCGRVYDSTTSLGCPYCKNAETLSRPSVLLDTYQNQIDDLSCRVEHTEMWLKELAEEMQKLRELLEQVLF